MSSDERQLVAQALSLYERIDLYRTRPDCFRSDQATDDRLRIWRTQCAGDDEDRFARRLRFEGFDRDSIRPVLGRIELPSDTPVPQWVRTLRECVPSLAVDLPGEGLPALRFRRARGEVAFQHYFEAWVGAAAGMLVRGVGERWDELSENVRPAFQVALLDDLSQSGRDPLIVEFDRFRYARLSTNALAEGLLTARPPRELYTRFVRGLLTDNATPFLHAYPCLARLFCTHIEFWIKRVGEFLGRLRTDAALLGSRFGCGRPPGCLDRLQMDLSDSHDGGRRVLLAELSGGVRVVYKPRSLAPERSWNDLVRWLGQKRWGLANLRPLSVIDRGTYGWMEVADVRPPRGQDETRDHFESCGALLALAHLMRGTDCHVDNVFAVGPSVVLVDAETLLEPEPKSPMKSAGSGATGLMEKLERSVLRAGLLPETISGPEVGPADVSGLTGSAAFEPPPRWVRVNTDVMVPANADEPAASAKGSSPENTGHPDVSQHVSDVVRGFSNAYRFFLGDGRRRFAKSSLATVFRSLRVRFVFRPSSTYSNLMKQARGATALTDGLAYSFAVDRLARPLLGAGGPCSPLWPVLPEEHRALLRGDLPLFTAPADGRTLLVRDPASGRLGRLPGKPLARSGWQGLRRTMASLSDEDLRFQKTCIELSLAGAAGGQPKNVGFERGHGESEATARFDARRALDAARRIAGQLADTAFADAGGGRDWIGLAADLHGQNRWVAALPPTLYLGAPGIAVFLAAAAGLDNDQRLRDVARSALAPLSLLIRDDPQAIAASFGLGGMSGVGGLIWAFTSASRLLGEPSFLEDARLLIGGITPATIDREQRMDLVSGVAGLILALRTVDGEPGFEGVSDLREESARHLFDAAVAWEGGLGWIDPEANHPLCGFSHGNSGIALALMAAWSRAQNPAYLIAARSALDAERALRGDSQGNWPDLRGPEPRWTASWCHGAPGIALARAAILVIDEVPGARADLAMAIETTRASKLDAGHLCCGTAGLDDVLLEVGRLTGDAALIDEARARIAWRVDSADRAGGWFVHPGFPAAASPPSLMSGLAGIGYGLLRSVNPDAFPSVLLLGGGKR